MSSLTSPRVLSAALCALALSGGLAACGSGGGSTSVSSSTASNTLTVYSSLPFRGRGSAAGRGLVNGEKLALAQANGKVGPFNVRFASLDEAPHGEAEPGTDADNARKAVEDRSTIAYLDGGGDASSELSVPVLNEAGILEVSPAASYVGLTRVVGAAPGEPDKYYPSGKRTFGRVLPSDATQAKAVAAWAKDKGCTSMYVLSDGRTAGTGLAQAVAVELRGQDITIAGNDAIDPTDQDFGDLGKKIEGAGADCAFYGGAADAGAVRLWRQLHAAVPDVKLFGPFSLATPAFAKAIGPAGDVTYLTSPYLSPSQYPASAHAFYAAYEKAYGETAPPDAIYGYEAMNTVLQAIKDAGEKGNDRQAVVDAFFNIKNRDSVLGPYSIDTRGDTTLSRYGGLAVKDGRLAFDQVIQTS